MKALAVLLALAFSSPAAWAETIHWPQKTAATTSPSGEFTMGVYAGRRLMQDPMWGDEDDQLTFGLEFDMKPGWSSVSLWFGAGAGGKFDDYYTRTRTTEILLGVRTRLIDTGRIVPFLSAGLAYQTAEVRYSGGYGSFIAKGSSVGLAVEAGVEARPSKLRLRLAIRGVVGASGTMDFDSGEAVSGTLDYWQIMGTLGFGSPGY